jgi:hypothetical protein
VYSKLTERGGESRDWTGIITEGLGMQARWQDQPTDFFSDRPFMRADQQKDKLFYQNPRIVQHLDEAALGMVRQLYGRFVHNDMSVLDLMSSWQSHMPAGIGLKRLAGLGLNEQEMNRNKQLSDFVVHDLNENPTLPIDDVAFDAVVCSLSVEYLTQPGV